MPSYLRNWRKIRVRWLISGIVFVPIAAYLGSLISSLANPHVQDNLTRMEESIFFGACIHIIVSFFLMAPRRKSWYRHKISKNFDHTFGPDLPFIYKAHRTPWGMNKKISLENYAQGISFMIPGILVLFQSLFFTFLKT